MKNQIIFVIALTMLLAFVNAKVNIGMRVLHITTEAILKNEKNVPLLLNSYGIPYDTIAFSKDNKITGNLTLYDGNEPKYNLIVIESGSLSYDNGTGYWMSYLSNEQWANLKEYEATYNVRRVVIDESVSADKGVALYKDNEWGANTEDQPLVPDDSEEVKTIFNNAGVKTTAPLDTNGIYHTRVKIIDTNSTMPFLYYTENGEKSGVAATISKYPDGREVMSFFYYFGSWSQSCSIINHIWLSWGTRSLFNGFRRVYFTPHIDDVFLSSDIVNTKNGNIDGEKSLRIEPFHYETFAKFQNDILDEMPKGSMYKVEMAFNGNGILYAIDNDKALEIDGERHVDLEFIKTPGTGEHRWPQSNYTFNFEYEFLEKDKVFTYFANNKTTQSQFFWSSHTFSHENLDNASRSDVDNEIRVNIEVAEILGLLDKDYYSGHSIITPQISGLRNADAIEVFKQYGIEAGTGDLSRPTIVNQENPYIPFFTTKESSNFEGFPIVPRTPTEVYYMCSTEAENTYIYNTIYKDHFGKDSTWDEIKERESKRTLLLLTRLRHEAHQFHQANLFYPTDSKGKITNKSLLEEWTRAIVKLYTQYVDWPLISLKLDDIKDSFMDKYSLSKCGQKASVIIDNDSKITGISVKATKSECTVPITLPYEVKVKSLPKNAKIEQVGNDPITVWVTLKKGESTTIELDSSMVWGSDNVDATVTTTELPTETETTLIDVTETLTLEPTITEVITTTEVKTTEAKTTEAKTTEAKTTEVPTTTVVKTTEAKTTEVPTTTEVKTTEAKTTEAKTTEVSSTTKAKTTEAATTTEAKTTQVSSTTVVSPTETQIAKCANKAYDRCGGLNFTGQTCCEENTVCHEFSIYYHQCLPLDSEFLSTTTKAASTSEAKTTEAKTTEVKTTEAKTTEVPTTTEAKTTEAKTTEVPTTTEAKTTEAKTTEVPTTTEAKTTEAKTTKVKTTITSTILAYSTTKAETTEAKTTEAKTTVAKTTEAKTTEAKTTEAKTTVATTKKSTTVKVTTTTTTTTTTTAVESIGSDGCVKLYYKCGGTDYDGPSCCEKGTVCHKFNEYYYQCISEDSIYNQTTTEVDEKTSAIKTFKTVDEPKTTVLTTTKTVFKTTVKPTTTASSASESLVGDCVKRYYPCGGLNYEGPDCCEKGFDCVEMNPYYHQCVEKAKN